MHPGFRRPLRDSNNSHRLTSDPEMVSGPHSVLRPAASDAATDIASATQCDAHSEGTFDRDTALGNPRLSRFQKVLLLSDGSVTELLAIYTGREIHTHKIEQGIYEATPPAPFPRPRCRRRSSR